MSQLLGQKKENKNISDVIKYSVNFKHDLTFLFYFKVRCTFTDLWLLIERVQEEAWDLAFPLLTAPLLHVFAFY